MNKLQKINCKFFIDIAVRTGGAERQSPSPKTQKIWEESDFLGTNHVPFGQEEITQFRTI